MKERIFALEEEIKHKNLSQIFVNKLLFRRRFDVHTTSISLKRRHTDVKTTSCEYWIRMENGVEFYFFDIICDVKYFFMPVHYTVELEIFLSLFIAIYKVFIELFFK